MADRALGNPLGNPLGLIAERADDSNSIGSIYSGLTSPGADYLPMKGQILKQADYPRLFEKVGLLNGTFSYESLAQPTGYAGADLICNGTVWVAICGTSLARSDNGGVSWTYVNIGVTPSHLRYASGGVWVVITTTNVVYRSTDNGVTWGLHPYAFAGITTMMGLSGNNVNSFFILGRTGANNYGIIFRSLDSGATWDSIVMPTSAWYSNVASFICGDNNTLTVTTSAGPSIVRSTDLGVTWATVYTTGSFSWTYFKDKITGTLYAVSYNGGMQISLDGGDTWQLTTTNKVWGWVASYGLSSQYSLLGIVFTPYNVFLGLTSYNPSGSPYLIISESGNNGVSGNVGGLMTGVTSQGDFDNYGNILIGRTGGTFLKVVRTFTYNPATEFQLPSCSPLSMGVGLRGLPTFIKAK